MFRFSVRPIPKALHRALLLTTLVSGPVIAGITDISDAPLASSTSAQVKPNVLFVLDDSGSMAWKYMPDGMSSNTIGYRNNSCNYIYYNPTIRYETPKNADGTDLNNATPTTFSAAYNDGFYSKDGGSSTKTNVSTSFSADDSESGRAAYYWKLNAAISGTTALTPKAGACNVSTNSGTTINFSSSSTGVCCTTVAGNDYNVCNNPEAITSPATCPAGKTLVWVKTVVSSTSGPATTDINGDNAINSSDADERQNFANWFSYYRTRLNMMKSSSGRALFPLTDKYRVGFMTIHPGTFDSSGAANGSSVSTGKFLGIKDFDATQRDDWFTKLYSQTTTGSTPLRTALSVAGRYYAGKNDSINKGMIPNQASDPVQYSCQQNFTILTTDGYWNDGNSRALDGSSTLTNQDGNTAELDAYNPTDKKFAVSAKPMHDGATAVYVWNTATKEYRLSSSGCSSGKRKLQYRYTTTSTSYAGPNQTGSVIGTPATDSTSWTTSISCTSPAPTLPATETITGATTPPTIPSGCQSGVQEWPCETYAATGGSEDTLADVAQYYYKTDLRTSGLGNCTGALGGTSSVCDNNVPSTGSGNEDDKASWQHMTTFTMGLGLSGTLNFSPTYKTDASGVFYDIRHGTTNWPSPNMSGDDPTNLDDLWHAAVNGRGQYFSARDPDSVIDSLSKALSGITARVASAAAAATSNLEPVAGDNFAYIAKYVTQNWTGELEAKEIDLASGAVGGTVIWSAATKLATKISAGCDTRDIKLFRSGAANNMVDFKWNTYTCDSGGLPTGSATTTLNATEQANFGSTQIQLLSQYPDMTDGTGTTVNQKAAAAGANLVNFLRGQSGKEGFEANDLDKLYRSRAGRLGDIINAQPVFVRAPGAQYTDNGYITFKANQTNRTPMIYVAANDGMLHAIKAGTSVSDGEGGTEAWAFMPSMVLPNLYKLASMTYASNHVFSVDGTPTSTDVFDVGASADCAQTTPSAPESCWKTILVGGLNKGGTGYYALDVTDPASPKALWEFKKSATCITVDATTKAAPAGNYADCHLGYTFGKPVIGKLSDGTWAVFVTSGYNNDDGQGYLYILKAMTGEILYRIGTGSGTAANPSGLNQISGWIDNASLNRTISRVYGVDLNGQIWRFDVNNTIAPAGREATLLAQVVDSSNNPQPITTKPELGEISGNPFVFVGTGKYLGTTDVSDTSPQTIWAIKDTLGTTAVSNIRTTLGGRTITNQGSGTNAYRTVAASGGQDCSTTGNGWYVDLPDSGERVNINMRLFQGTLIAASNVPEQNACNIGGYSWFNYFDYRTGCAVKNSTNQSVGTRLVGSSGTQSLAVGINIVTLPGGKTVAIATTSAAEQLTLEPKFDYPAPIGKRVGWREIVQ